MLGQAKLAFFRTAHATGSSSALGKSNWRRQRLLLLCYHGVSVRDEHSWNPELYITAQRLEERLSLLRDLDANILSLSEALQRLAVGSLPPRAVVITFDDGAADFALRAMPVLRKYEAPATVYLTTYYVERPCMPVWNTAASYILWRARHRRAVDLQGLITSSRSFDLHDALDRKAALDAFRHHWQSTTTEAKHDALGRLASTLDIDFAEILHYRQLQLMTPDEVSGLPSDLIQVELHTHRHRTPLDSALFRRELDENHAIIQDLTGRAPHHFCYPSGHARPEFLDWLREAGVESATTCAPGLATSRHNPLLLPRLVDTSHTPRETFVAWVTGVAAWLPNRTRTLARL